jgi:hypothetical protein
MTLAPVDEECVWQGQGLCLLATRDLALERRKWSTQRDQFLKEYREAMAKHDRTQTRITKRHATSCSSG